MNRILMGLTGAAALAGLAVTAPSPASANPVILAPVAAAAILGGTAVGGTLLGTAISANGHQAEVPVVPAQGPVVAAGPPVAAEPPVAVEPGCYMTRARIHGVWHRVRVCD